MEFIPAFPYLYSLRRINKTWKRQMEERVYGNVQLLDLLDMDFSADQSKFRNFVGYTEATVNLTAINAVSDDAEQSETDKAQRANGEEEDVLMRDADEEGQEDEAGASSAAAHDKVHAEE